MKIDIKPDFRQVQNYMATIGKKAVERSTYRGINYALTKTNSASVKLMHKEMGTRTQTQIRKTVKLTKARPGKLHASMATRGRPLPLISFKSTRGFKAGSKSGAYGVRRQYPGTFMAKMRSGHVGVFKRVNFGGGMATGKVDRLPIKELYGPSVPGTMKTREVTQEQKNVARANFLNEYARLIQMEINKAAAAR